MKTKYRLFYLFLSLFSSHVILAQIPTNGLVGFYEFDGNPNDASGNGQDGTDKGAALYIPGVCDLARYFHNSPTTTENFDYTYIPNIINSTAFTISFRTKVKSTGIHQSFLYLSSGNNWVFANLWLFLTTEDKLCAIVNGLDLRTIDYSHNALVDGQFNNNYLNSAPLQWDQYYFITCVFHNKILTFYLNGNKYSEYLGVNTQIGTPATTVKLGICPEIPQPGFYYFMDGIMDRLSIYNRALSENEINSLYNSNCSHLSLSKGKIDGITQVCQGQRNIDYTVSEMQNIVSYSWSYTGTGTTIKGTSESIMIDFAENATSGTLTVIGNKMGGIEADTANLSITLNPLPSAAGNITGESEVCINQNGVNYQIEPITNASNYVWNYSGTGATIIGNTENAIINFAQSASNGNLTVAGNNNCGNGAPSPPFAINLKSCINNLPLNLNIPNSFSPNGDGINDVFFIRGLTENTRLIIFNRDGKKLYETASYQNNWGGRDSTDHLLEPGTYWYVLILPGLPTEFKGFVYIKP